MLAVCFKSDESRPTAQVRSLIALASTTSGQGLLPALPTVIELGKTYTIAAQLTATGNQRPDGTIIGLPAVRVICALSKTVLCSAAL